MHATETKTCTKCGLELPATAEFFSRHPSCRFGLMSKCKACEAAYRQANVEKSSKQRREYRQANADAIRERKRKYSQANADSIRERKRRWRQANADAIRERNREYRQANLDKNSERNRRRRAKMRGNGVFTVSPKDQRRLDAQPCAHAHLGPCNGKLEVDHIIPISRGGSHGIGNLQMLCRHHNSSKKDSLEVEVRYARAAH